AVSMDVQIDRSGRAREHRFPWQAQLALFTVLAAGFGYATYTDLYGAGEAFSIVTFVMAAVAAMFLVTGIVTSLRKRR
ncbi:MAG TPA: hypothetical protein VEA15_01800, partial [Caulobacteraceae bacterium]|nr:hypothetical protein [Caulobacteraceae bacterium]